VAILLGDCYLQLGEYDRGLTLLARWAKTAGDNPDSYGLRIGG